MSTQTENDKATFREPLWQACAGVAMLLIGLVITGGLALKFLAEPVSEWDGQTWLLVLLSPILLVMLLALIIGGACLALGGLTRYELDPDGVTQRGLLRKRRMAWADVTNFALSPASFPDPPDSLVLISDDSRQMSIPMNVKPKGQIQGMIQDCLPAVSEYGIERVKQVRGIPSFTGKSRWDRIAGSLFGVIGGSILFLLCAGVSYLSIDKYIDYRRIIANPVAVEAEIIEIDSDEDRTLYLASLLDQAITTRCCERFKPRGRGA